MTWRRSAPPELAVVSSKRRRDRLAGRPAFRSCCPRCGVPFPQVMRGEWFETSLRCTECGVAVREDSPPLAPSPDDIGYALGEFSILERTAITADLIELRIPFRWENGLVLVVAKDLEEYVDRLIDDVTADDAEGDPPPSPQ